MNELYLIAIAILLIVVIVQFSINRSAIKDVDKLTKRLNDTSSRNINLEKEIKTLIEEKDRLMVNKPISNAKAEAEAIIANARRKAEILKNEAIDIAKKEAKEYREKSSKATTSRKKQLSDTYKNKINFTVKGTGYREPKEIQAAINLEVGDIIFMEWEPNNLYDDYAMRVITAEGILIGYVEKQYSKLFYDKTVSMAEITKITNDDIPFIYANAMW